MDSIRNCIYCLHQPVCKFKQNYDLLVRIGRLSFECEFFLGKLLEGKEKQPEVIDEHPELSIDELSRLVNGDSKEPEAEIGDCSSCGKKNIRVYTCEKCHKKFCGECISLKTELNLDGSSKDMYICHSCEEAEDE